MEIPSSILKQLYTTGSLRNVDTGIQFSLKNRLSDAMVTEINSVRIGDQDISPENLYFSTGNGRAQAHTVSSDNPIDFPLRQIVDIFVDHPPLSQGNHDLEISVETSPFGMLKIEVEDKVETEAAKPSIPRSVENDYSDEIITARQNYVAERTGVSFEHITHHSFEPQITKGNVESFFGVAQIPIGIAGPIKVNGEHAQGEFFVPLATTEGTLVASYNRGIKVINQSGGVKCTVVDDAMQRAPVFVFDDARGTRDFVKWIDANMDDIRREAESTSSVAKLSYIDHYLAGKFAYLRFNFTTGDAAGQNMVGSATFAACRWIGDNWSGEQPIRHFYLESNFATDKKGSMVNLMRTRGKRMVAEIVVPRDVLIRNTRATPEQLIHHSRVANVGAIMSGANNNGLHSANGITAMFIATGQDVANVAESSSGIIYTELTPEDDLYVSMTIPSLIVATYGGGTGLATQNECLKLMGCDGVGKVMKFAEIVAGVVMAGELSLASAISTSDWVSSHETFGRNR